MSGPFQNLTPEQYSRVSQLLDQSIELPPNERDAWLTDLGARDPEAAALLRRLFASQSAAAAARFLEDRDRIAHLTEALETGSTLAGRQFGPYRILSLLGHGGMGSVWLAERVDGLFSRQVALKLVHTAFTSPVLTERLGREREILASLSHAHIARLFDAGFGEDGQPYLALQYIAGKPLTHYGDEYRLSVAARLELFRQILSAVQYAHAHGVIHRDLKPSNILVTQDGDAQLLDFGIAKLLTDGAARETQLTLLGGRALTPEYAAPEQIAGAPITTAADVYSLGVIFYELLTGERPYRLKRESRGALEEAILQAEPLAPSRMPLSDAAATARATTPRRLAKALAGDLDTIALKALKKLPAERYATANAFDEDIARYLRGDVVLARTDSLAYRVRKFVRRHRLGIGVAGFLVLILAAGLAATSYEAKVASAQRDEALQAQWRLLTQTAAARLKSGDIHGAMAIILEVLPQRAGERAMSPETLNVFEGARAADAGVLALAGHAGRVNYASFSPDSSRVVTASNDNTAGIWDAASGEQVLTLTGHTAPLTAAEFSSDGRRIVTAAIDGSARVWETASGRELLALRGQGDHVNSATFSPDGSRILTASDDKSAYLWEGATGTLIRKFSGHSDRVASAFFSPDGRRIVTASDDKTAILWDAATGRLLRVFGGHTDRVWFAAFSPDGARIVTASYDKTARIWDAANARELVRLVGHTAPVSSAVFSPDGRYVATAAADSTACIWDAASGRLLQPLSGHTDRVWSALFSPDSKRVVTASDDRTARIWQVEPRAQLQVLRGHTASITSAHFSRDGQRVVTTSDDTTARVWDAATGREIQRFADHTAPVPSAMFSPDGTRVVTASTDRTARIWEVATGRELVRFTGHTDQVAAAAFSHDGKRAATASIERTARVWDAATGRELALMTGHTDLVGSVAFSPDDTRIVTSSSDQTARIWDAATGRQQLLLRGHTGQLWSAEFSPDGRHVLTASSDHTARLWDATSGVETQRLVGLSDNVSSADYSPDGARVVISVGDQTARIWDVATGRQILALVGHTDALQFAAFAPDGGRVVTASDDATARIWDVRTAALEVQVAWAAAAEFDSLSSTQRYELGLPAPANARAWTRTHTPCDEAAGAPEDPDRVTPGVPAAEVVADLAIAACARATGAALSDARTHFENARALVAGGQVVAARAELEQAVSRGYRAARVDLALLLAQLAATADTTRAIALGESAWEDGDMLAAFELGSIYEHGVGRLGARGDEQLRADETLAWRWYRRGADALEPHALARFAAREEKAAATATSASECDRHRLEAFKYYAAAAEAARREDWPDGAWRIWRFRRASLARVLALDGQMPEVASAFDAVRARR
jgi:WD40 repeat protein/serine/threonine protein kinase